MQRKLVLPGAWRAFTVVVVCLAALTPSAARADGPRPPIVLVLDPCARVDAQEVRRLVPIEMGAPLGAGAGDPRDTTRVSVGCVAGAPQLVRLEVRDPTTGRTLDRDVTLEGVSKANQARLVAIASVELVAASQGDPVRAVEAVPAAGALAVTATPAPSPAPPRWRALASGSLRAFAGMPRALVGGDVAVERQFPRRFDLVADVDVAGAAQPTAIGDVDALVASLGLVGALRGARGRATWEAGVGARGGVARLSGQRQNRAGVEASTLSAPWIGPLVAARATLAFGRVLVASLGAEVGYVTSGVVGHVVNHPDVGVHGAWWGATLGVGFAR